MWFVIATAVIVQNPQTIVRCTLREDSSGRVYELMRRGEGESAAWLLGVRSRETGASPIRMAMPGARPVLKEGTLALDYRTLNGGRSVRWTVGAAASSLDVYVNYELEVNVEADLDPRVELMNTEGPVTQLECEVRQ